MRMQPEQLIDNGGEAVRRTKYYSGGNREWKRRPATSLDKRYATAAMVQVLHDLASTGTSYGPQELTAIALDIEREGGDL